MVWLAQSVDSGRRKGGDKGDKKIFFLIYFFVRILSTEKSIFRRGVVDNLSAGYQQFKRCIICF